MLRDYYYLTKPGIIHGNLLIGAAGFLLASKSVVDYGLFIAMLTGLALVMASGCVLNNYLDRDIDKLMDRTKNRALVTGVISNKSAIIYGVVLGLIGFFILYFYTNPLTAFIALAGAVIYILIYTTWKRHSIYGPHLGSLAGAVPPVVGYCSITNSFDAGAIILFLTLCIWQMPHFFSIAIYRARDYAYAKIPTFLSKKGMLITKINILVYIVLFIVSASMLYLYSYTGIIYLAVMTLAGLAWLALAIKDFKSKDTISWGRKMFFSSLGVLMTLCIMLSLEALI